MTQEDKQLLYKDLAARQPYRPFICFAGKVTMPFLFLDVIASTKSNELMSINGLSPDEVKPYLRPMSSMTKEERKELSKILNYEFYIDDDFALVAEDDRHRIRLELCEGYIDWLNAHHFDFRGLIPMGLAIEAPEGMYKNE